MKYPVFYPEGWEKFRHRVHILYRRGLPYEQTRALAFQWISDRDGAESIVSRLEELSQEDFALVTTQLP